MKEKEREIRRYLLFLIVMAGVMFLTYFEGGMNEQNTTALALSYRYGLIPRGLVGTGVSVLAHLGIHLYSYRGALMLSAAVTLCFFVVLFTFYYVCLKHCSKENLPYAQIGILFLSVFIFPEYATVNNFGRLDEYLMILTLSCLILLVEKKAQWLVVPLCLAAGLVHIGFVFTNLSVVLVILWVRMWEEQGKMRRYYGILLAVVLCLEAGLFLYFEVLRQPISMDAYQQIVDKANGLSEKGAIEKDAYSLLKSELLGEDVFADEWVWHTKNYAETPIFLLLFLLYIIIFVFFFRRLFHKAANAIERWKYAAVALGIATILPELVLKVDYGRWMFCIIAYYCLVILCLLANDDRKITETLRETVASIRGRIPFAWILLLYPMLFVPFRDVYISDVTTWLMDHVEAPLLGLW
jgi:hypothetical protein